jgi:hypothetical protein
MLNREVFRWMFMCSGLWLMLSPFLLLGGQSGFSDAAAGEAGILMILGLLALIMAGYSYSKHNLVRSNLGFALGLALVAAPWMAKFTDNIATLNAVIVGFILTLVAFLELSKPQKMHVS